jgi:hypothetical protein
VVRWPRDRPFAASSPQCHLVYHAVRYPTTRTRSDIDCRCATCQPHDARREPPSGARRGMACPGRGRSAARHPHDRSQRNALGSADAGRCGGAPWRPCRRPWRRRDPREPTRPAPPLRLRAWPLETATPLLIAPAGCARGAGSSRPVLARAGELAQRVIGPRRAATQAVAASVPRQLDPVMASAGALPPPARP